MMDWCHPPIKQITDPIKGQKGSKKPEVDGREMLVRPGKKREQRIAGYKAEKAGQHGRGGHAQVLPNQTGKQSRQPDPGHRVRAKREAIVDRWVTLRNQGGS